MLLLSTEKEVTLGFFILSSAFNAWFAVSSHSLYSYFRWSLNGFFTKTCVLATTSNVAFMSGVKCPFSESKTSGPCFLRTAHDLLFHITKKFIGFTAFSLESDSDSARQLFLRHCFAI
jgi:hypothetical protein